MTAFAAALFLQAKADAENVARQHGISVPEHCEFITTLHNDLKDRCHGDEIDYSLDPITAAENRDANL